MPRNVGDYVLETRIGSGGMGVVHLGRHRLTGWTRAVKQPLVAISDVETEATFLREAQAQGRLDHANVTPIYEASKDEDGTPYIVMEYFERGALTPFVGGLTQRETGRVVVDVLRGLEHAHDRGVLHRDIKPGNLMVTRTGTIKIADFGIARILGEARSAQTVEGLARGDFGYIAPEALTEDGSDQRGDLYAVGVVAFELLTGAVPFAEETARLPPDQRPYYKCYHSAPSLERSQPGIDGGLARWVASLLHRDPGKRPRTAREALEQFQEIAARLWGPEWEISTRLPADAPPARPATERVPDARLVPWSAVTRKAPATDLARNALLKPRNLVILGLGVVATVLARQVTQVLRPGWALAALAVLYLGSCAVTFFDVAEADRVRRRQGATDASGAPASDDDTSA